MKQGTYTVIPGDATKPAGLGKKPIVIPHVCNTEGAWGAGFVVAITRAFGGVPELAYRHWSLNLEYGKEHVKNIKTTGAFSLGEVQFVKLADKKTVIANMIGQQSVRSYGNERPPIRYGALISCMRKVRDVALAAKAEIHCPKFGSDLAGGKWEAIEQMIFEKWVDFGINVTVYEFVPKDDFSRYKMDQGH